MKLQVFIGDYPLEQNNEHNVGLTKGRKRHILDK